jgi:WXG100 family type VII secretion target
MTSILVTPEQLQQVASQLNAGAANIESTLGQLASQVAPLQSEWRGVAQVQFESLWSEWQRASAGIQHALHGISQLTSAAAASYSDTDHAVAASFGHG